MFNPRLIRRYGVIPERRHDAFLLALLLAVFLNLLAAFAIREVLPWLLPLLRTFSPPRLAEEEDEAPNRLFILVDSPLPPDEDPSEFSAESDQSRLASQPEPAPELAEGDPFQAEGTPEPLSFPGGNPGPAPDPGEDSGEAPLPGPEAKTEPAKAEAAEIEPAEAEAAEIEPAEAEAAEIEPAEAEAAETEPLPAALPEPAGEPPAMAAPPVPPGEPDPPAASEPPPPPPEAAPEPPSGGPEAEPPPPEAAPEPPSGGPEAETESPDSPEPELPIPPDEGIDLASLPEIRAAGPGPEFPRPARLPIPSGGEAAEPAVPVWRPEPESPPAQPTPAEASRPRPQPRIRRIGGADSAGGAPPRRNRESRVDLLRSGDAIMNLLAHRHGEYMRKMARQLQDSLNRQMILAPFDYTRGQVRIKFGVNPDGSLAFQTTLFPLDGGMELERILSERTVREAAPFEPFGPEMLKDAELFQNLTVVVNLF
ncbi:MAG: hypothetical protein LBU64_10795 [Planctomycetota bacterium]|jgi:hypothetical protein|nr:hypothetical protein [Planctomycetota bacterium]